jgi:two-component system, LytTR family, sensor kinase
VTPLHLLVLAQPAARASAWSVEEIVGAASGLTTGLTIALLVARRVRRMPWPRPFRARFVASHVVTALAAIAAWVVSSSVIETLVLGGSAFRRVDDRWNELLFIGSLMYAIVAGVSHAVEATARAARAEAAAARTQLAALRAQLQPHFLFNALHTVVQLIPIEPQRAMEAAELVADLLRATLEEQRDEVTLGDEWDFVSRYLAVERIRFGDRLVVRSDLAAGLLDERVPAYALQTLVENAVRHGAAPRVAATEIVVTADGSAAELTLSVRNTGDGAPARAEAGAGTGLARLRERLAVLYGSAARLACGPAGDGGYEAVLVVPRHRGRES